MKDFKIVDTVGFGYSENLGVFFYDSRVYCPEKNEDGNRSYKFKLKIVPSDLTIEQRIGKEKSESENIEFIATIDLKDYVKTSQMSEEMFKRFQRMGETSKEIKRLDYKKITEDFFPELEEVKDRLNRKITNKKVNQTVVKAYEEDVEFLYFTEETADNWGGPYTYTIDNKERKGCILSKDVEDHKNEYFERIDNEKNNFLNKVRYYNIPQTQRPEYSFDDLSKKDKKKFLDTLDSKTLMQTYKDTMDFEGEMSLNFFEYNLHLGGNDDFSYTKGFHSKEELLEELEYLRMMQPLDIYRDIYDRGYFFTN